MTRSQLRSGADGLKGLQRQLTGLLPFTRNLMIVWKPIVSDVIEWRFYDFRAFQTKRVT